MSVFKGKKCLIANLDQEINAILIKANRDIQLLANMKYIKNLNGKSTNG